MELSKVNCTYGAPMGRREHHAHGMDDLEFELERMPLTDGAYDAGGAYWGGGTDLWCAVATLDGEELARHFYRAHSREVAMDLVREDYPEATFLPENGSLIEQMISHLQAYCNRCRERDPDEDLRDTEIEIDYLYEQLAEIEENRA